MAESENSSINAFESAHAALQEEVSLRGIVREAEGEQLRIEHTTGKPLNESGQARMDVLKGMLKATAQDRFLAYLSAGFKAAAEESGKVEFGDVSTQLDEVRQDLPTPRQDG